MADPTASGVTVIAASAAAIPAIAAVPHLAPQIVVFGMALGLRADVLLAGFFGSVVALAFFNTVPSTGDTWRALVNDTFRRMWWCLASSLTAGYLVPLLMIVESDKLHWPESVLLSLAFVTGAGAQRWLARFVKKGEAKIDAIDKAAGGGP